MKNNNIIILWYNLSMENKSRKKLYVVSGSSGVGKGTVLKWFMAKHPDFMLSISCTTRKPRNGEIDGVRVTSEYGHISSWNVHIGQKVKQGDIIAKSGNEGVSTGPHLHITIREGKFQGKAVNPAKYINADF